MTFGFSSEVFVLVALDFFATETLLAYLSAVLVTLF
jgi:hypothetical protein